MTAKLYGSYTVHKYCNLDKKFKINNVFICKVAIATIDTRYCLLGLVMTPVDLCIWMGSPG